MDRTTHNNYTYSIMTKDIYDRLASMNQILGTVSTISPEGKPQAATVYFTYDEDLNIYFITKDTSRKYKNILNNPNVAFVITSEHPALTVQLEGVAKVVDSALEEVKVFSKLVATAVESNFMPPVSQIQGGKTMFIKIDTTWARTGDFAVMKDGDKFTEEKLQ